MRRGIDRVLVDKTETGECREPSNNAVELLAEWRAARSLGFRSNRLSKHGLVVAIPVTLKTPRRIILLFELEKLLEVGVAGQHLVAAGKAMVGQVIGSFAFRRHVDQTAKGVCRVLYPFRGVNRVQVEDCAGIGLLCPRQKG